MKRIVENNEDPPDEVKEITITFEADDSGKACDFYK